MDKKIIVELLKLVKGRLDLEDVADLLEGFKDACDKGMSYAEAVFYAILETQSEEVAAGGLETKDRLGGFINGEYSINNPEHLQQLIRAVYRDTAKSIA